MIGAVHLQIQQMNLKVTAVLLHDIIFIEHFAE